MSCADEVVAKLLLDGRGAGRVVVLRGLREDQHEAIEHVLDHHRLAVAAMPRAAAPAPRLLGWVTADAPRGVRVPVRARRRRPRAELAGALGWPAARAGTRCRRLAFHRLVRTDGDRYQPLPVG